MAHTVDARFSIFNDIAGNQYNISVSNDSNATILEKTFLKPAEMDASDRPQCLPGTRQDIRDFITCWAINPSDKKILWIHGVAGSGKSTLATTVANFFREGGCVGVRLGAFLFFNRDVAERNYPGAVIRTLASQLCQCDSRIGSAVVAAIGSNPNICTSSLQFQFRKLLVEPLSALNTSTTILIVMDALDECGSPTERKHLLKKLAKESINFPSTVRMIVTSRAEYDICSTFECEAHILTRELDITTATNATDIALYTRHRMANIREAKKHLRLASDWPGEHIVHALSQRALGLFVWASTATEFIDAHDPRKRIEMLLKGTSEVESSLDNLYQTALNSAAMWDDEDLAHDFQAIMGIVLVARTPLSTDAIDNLLGPSESRPSIHTISLFGCVLAQNPTVRVLHPSFADFLSNRERCGRDVWFIEISSHNHRLVILCLQLLDAGLEPNMCNLTLSSEEWGSLSDGVAYACVFWIEHVRMVEGDAESIAAHAYAFLRKHLLHWLEAMSILKRSRESVRLLYHLLDWFQSRWPRHSDMFTFIYHAWRFVQAFADSIEDHPLLVYMTALPFTPADSPIYMSYMESGIFPYNSRDFEVDWPPNLLVLSKHDGPVSSVSFSPDATLVVSGSHDRTIRVWDSSSGVEVLPPLRGHQDAVTSVVFSSDGLRMASSSRDRTIRIWNVATGAEILPPLHGHHDWVISASFSPDGTHIVSGSRDHTIRVWNSTSGQEALSAFQGHEASVTSVSYSPDGKHIASGSQDRTVRVWSAVSGAESLPPLRGHQSAVLSVCFSPEGDCILSGSQDKSVRMWNAATGEMIGLFNGHEKSVNSAVFSSDGEFVMSGSDDRTIRLWGVPTCGLLTPPLQGHQGHILSLTFHSKQGMRIASGSADHTVRIWEVRDLDIRFPHPHMKLRSLRHHPNGIGADVDVVPFLFPSTHRGAVLALAFSPDGSRVASCSKDMTIRISDANQMIDCLPTFQARECVKLVMFSPDCNLVVSVSVCETIRVWDIESRKEASVPPVWRWRPWISSTEWSPDATHICTGAIGPVDAESDILLSMLRQSVERHRRSIEHPDIFVTSDGWINCVQPNNDAVRISKLPPVLSACTVVFASHESKIAFGTQSGQLVVLHFPEGTMMGTVNRRACAPLPRFLLVHDNWWETGLFAYLQRGVNGWPVLAGTSFMKSFAKQLRQTPKMPMIAW